MLYINNDNKVGWGKMGIKKEKLTHKKFMFDVSSSSK